MARMNENFFIEQCITAGSLYLWDCDDWEGNDMKYR